MSTVNDAINNFNNASEQLEDTLSSIDRAMKTIRLGQEILETGGLDNGDVIEYMRHDWDVPLITVEKDGHTYRIHPDHSVTNENINVLAQDHGESSGGDVTARLTFGSIRMGIAYLMEDAIYLRDTLDDTIARVKNTVRSEDIV